MNLNEYYEILEWKNAFHGLWIVVSCVVHRRLRIGDAINGPHSLGILIRRAPPRYKSKIARARKVANFRDNLKIFSLLSCSYLVMNRIIFVAVSQQDWSYS